MSTTEIIVLLCLNANMDTPILPGIKEAITDLENRKLIVREEYNYTLTNEGGGVVLKILIHYKNLFL